MLVIDKPAGLVVHPNPGSARTGVWQESLEDYLGPLRFELAQKPMLAHRLDRDTTGCLVLGRHEKAIRKLHKLFLERQVRKTYWAVCIGAPKRSTGWIDAPLEKVNDRQKGWRVMVSDDGQLARTRYIVQGRSADHTFIECFPTTGRTHQLRVHLASIGCPILGDPAYGEMTTAQRDHPMMLHARSIELPIAKTKPPVNAHAPPPETMQVMIDAMGDRKGGLKGSM